ncbi:MAG: hypothetical protein HOV87_20350 [Catenulispora sp.]|nr:hypothetical protein [Catenulispora sp.]
MCAATFVVLLYSVRKLDFYYDEWDFVDRAEHWRFSDYFVPHQEHWSTVPMVVYRLLLGLNGMHSYLPFSATLLLLHSANAFLLFLLVRRRCGDALGIGAAAILLVLGRGSDDFIWAFQIGFSCSVFFGLTALLLLDEPRANWSSASASAALVLSLASSGEGLFFVAAAAVLLLLRSPGFRTLAATLAPPIAAYAIWYPLYGAKHADIARSPLSLHAAAGLLTFVPTGLGAGVAGLVGLDWHQAWIGFALFVAVFAYVCRRGRDAALAIALGVGVIAQFSATGLVRAQFGTALAGASRYVYIAAVFTLPILAEALRNVSWRPRRVELVAVAAAVSCFCGALTLNNAIDHRNRTFERQKAMLQTVWFHRADPRLNPDAVIDPEDAPTLTVRLYLRTRAELGSPLPEIDAKALGALDTRAVARAQKNVLLPQH